MSYLFLALGHRQARMEMQRLVGSCYLQLLLHFSVEIVSYAETYYFLEILFFWCFRIHMVVKIYISVFACLLSCDSINQ